MQAINNVQNCNWCPTNTTYRMFQKCCFYHSLSYGFCCLLFNYLSTNGSPQQEKKELRQFENNFFKHPVALKVMISLPSILSYLSWSDRTITGINTIGPPPLQYTTTAVSIGQTWYWNMLFHIFFTVYLFTILRIYFLSLFVPE